MPTYALGDIQGCYEPLQSLLARVKFDPARDRLWLAGDLVNRGPQSLEVLRWAYAQRERLTITLGNHDLHALAVWHGAAPAKGKDTLDELLAAPDAGLLFDWLRQQPLFHFDPQLGYAMVHAGVIPAWDVATARARAGEVQEVLARRPRDLLEHMYGDDTLEWSEGIAGSQRLRMLTNIFTRMRFCTAEGKLEFKSKGPANSAPSGYLPWFAHASRRTAGTRLLFGHWATLSGVTDSRDAIALDTGCVWGNCLRALRLEDGACFHESCA
jgi:bis(5'-nucleosyl)-tetraphosphatase (symmetrical)